MNTMALAGYEHERASPLTAPPIADCQATPMNSAKAPQRRDCQFV